MLLDSWAGSRKGFSPEPLLSALGPPLFRCRFICRRKECCPFFSPSVRKRDRVRSGIRAGSGPASRPDVAGASDLRCSDVLVRSDSGHRAVSTRGSEDSLGGSLGPAAAGHDGVMPSVCHAVSPQASAVQPDQEGAEPAEGGRGPGGSDGEAPWVSAPVVATSAAHRCVAHGALVAGAGLLSSVCGRRRALTKSTRSGAFTRGKHGSRRRRGR